MSDSLDHLNGRCFRKRERRKIKKNDLITQRKTMQNYQIAAHTSEQLLKKNAASN